MCFALRFDGHHKGWKMTGKTKRGALVRGGALKRKAHELQIDLKTFRPTKIEHSFDDWLADSRPAWSQLLYVLRTQRQIKKQKTDG